MSRFRWLSKLPNIISVFRLLAAPVLLMLAFEQKPETFAGLLIPALLSDAADGWIARQLHCESRLGALLDSAADITLMTVIIISIWFLHPVVYQQHWHIIAIVFVVWSFAHLLALFRYRRPASFHTRLLQSGILLFALFAIILFTHGFLPWLLYLTGVVSLLGAAEHIALLYLLPQWTPDIRGGLFEVLRVRREQ